ncbi:MAG: DNA-protecting protein DprA [Candidatus Hydrogenedentes bacterium]|nr:DNA-protecting protein DprA [Candidatus Hydrogenedentota bacterium]
MPLTDEQRSWVTLALVPGVGTAMFIRLLARFRTPEAVLNASRRALEEVVGPKLTERIAQYSDVADVAGQEAAMAKAGASLITLEDPAYPLRLAEIYDPPLLLFIRGRMLEAEQPCVAIVGTRRATPYGIRMAEKFGRELGARGVTVVSGMANGIDSAAHRGALDAGGNTIAVLGCGVDIVYPQQNAELMRDIIAHGSVVSQFPMGTTPSPGHFPYRNRIISGMSLGTLVIEAPLSSGALITARQAAEQGREVFAIPGQIGVVNSQGPHLLIREGAKLVESVDDILVELELPSNVRVANRAQPAPAADEDRQDRAAPSRPQLSVVPQQSAPPRADPPKQDASTNEERRILDVLSPNGSHVDEIAQACRVSVSQALSALTLLELKGLVRQFSGKRFAPK